MESRGLAGLPSKANSRTRLEKLSNSLLSLSGRAAAKAVVSGKTSFTRSSVTIGLSSAMSPSSSQSLKPSCTSSWIESLDIA